MPPMSLKGAIRFARELESKLAILYIPNQVDYCGYVVTPEGSLSAGPITKVEEKYAEPAAALSDFILKMRGIAVRVFYSTKANHVGGVALWVTPKRVDVILPAKATMCVKRFSVVKELLHYCDASYSNSETTSKSVIEALESAMRSFRRVDGNGDVALHAEAFCFFAAVEMLFYWGSKGGVRKHLMELHSDNVPDMILAKLFKVPLLIEQFFFESGYSEKSLSINFSI